MKNICFIIIMIFVTMDLSAVTFSKTVMTRKEWDEAVRSGKIKMGLRACPYEREEFARNRHLFPSDRIVSGELPIINDIFLMDNGDLDLWREFLPLLETMVRHQESVGFAGAKSRERQVMQYFVQYAFANDEESRMIKADFSGRLLCLEKFINFYVVRNDVEMLYRIAEWIGRSKYLPEGDAEYNEAIKKAALKDLERIYDADTIFLFDIRKALKNVKGPHKEQVRSVFEFRKVYNKRLKEFREKALVMIREAIMDYAPKYYKIDSEIVWGEFCKRGNISKEERVKVESLVREKTKTQVSWKKGGEVKGESSCK